MDHSYSTVLRLLRLLVAMGEHVYTRKTPKGLCHIIRQKDTHITLAIMLKNRSQNWTCLSSPLVLPRLGLLRLVVEQGGRRPLYTPAPPARLPIFVTALKGSCQIPPHPPVNRNHAAKPQIPLYELKYLRMELLVSFLRPCLPCFLLSGTVACGEDNVRCCEVTAASDTAG